VTDSDPAALAELDQGELGKPAELGEPADLAVTLEGIELVAALLGLVDLLDLGDLPAAVELVQFARELCALYEAAQAVKPAG